MTTEHTVWLLLLQLCHKPNLSFVFRFFFFFIFFPPSSHSCDATALTQTFLMHFVVGVRTPLKERLGPICCVPPTAPRTDELQMDEAS